MHDKFWHGILWGGLLGAAAVMLWQPQCRSRRKPLVERGAEAVVHTTQELWRDARRARRKMLRQVGE